MSGRKGADLGLTAAALGITLASLGGAKSTVAAGLPGFAGRAQGDLHQNLTDGNEYVLTGLGGSVLVTDDFNRANGTIANGSLTSSGAVYTVPGAAPPILGNAVVFDSNNGYAALVNLGGVTQDVQGTITNGSGRCHLLARSAGAANTGYTLHVESFSPVSVVLRKGGTSGSTLATILPSTAPSGVYRMVVTGTTTTTIKVYKDNVLLATVTDSSSPITTGNFAGFYGSGQPSGSTVTLDDFSAIDPGSFAWTPTTQAMVYKGVWDSAVAYLKNEVVIRSGGLYLALSNIVGNTDPVTPPGTTAVFASSGTQQGPGSGSGPGYLEQQFIPTANMLVGSVLHRAKGSTAGATTHAELWQGAVQIASSGEQAAVTGANTTYTFASAVSLVGGVTYKLRIVNSLDTFFSDVISQAASTATGGTFPAASNFGGAYLYFTLRGTAGGGWQKIASLAGSGSMNYLGPWGNLGAYAANDVVTDAYSLWVALTAVPAGSSYEPALFPSYVPPANVLGGSYASTLASAGGTNGHRSIAWPIVTSGGSVSSITLGTGNSGNGVTGPARVGIATAIGSDAITGIVWLGATPNNAAVIPNSNGTITFQLPAPVTLVGGTTYYVVVQDAGSGVLPAGNTRGVNAGNDRSGIVTGSAITTYGSGAGTTWGAPFSYAGVFALNSGSLPYWQKIGETSNQKNVGQVAASGAAVTIGDPEVQPITRVVLTANCTITLPPVIVGKSFKVVVVQDATGGRTLTWAATNPAIWPGGVTPTQTATALKGDVYEFFADGSANWIGTVVGQNY